MSRALSSGVPSAQWKEGDVSHVAFRCHAHGADERTTYAFLDTLDHIGVRRLRPYVDGMTSADFLAQLDRAAELAAMPTTGRGRRDILQIRTPARWPWRTSTAQKGQS